MKNAKPTNPKIIGQIGASPAVAPRLEKNYQYLRAMLISAKREREGRFNIDLAECSDLAWDMAGQLPDGVTLTRPQPSDNITGRLVLGIVAVSLMILVATLTL